MQSATWVTLEEFALFLFDSKLILFTDEQRSVVEQSFNFLNNFSKDKIIYGINTGFGPMAQYRIADTDLKALQYNIIRSHATGAGAPLPDLYVRAAMIARLTTFLQGKSGVHPELIEQLCAFINRGIYPIVPEHGSVGASGDLVQLAHISLALIGEGEVRFQGIRQPTANVFKKCDLSPITMHIREGLSVSNGTSVMTGIGLINLIYAKRLLSYAVASSVLINEVVSSFDDLMSEQLNQAKHHAGQQWIALQMRAIATGSQRLPKRKAILYDMRNEEKIFSQKIQPYYSLRCVPQILGPVYDTLAQAEKVLVNELNSVDDNPIIDAESNNIYHGGNFHGDYVALEMDKLKTAITKLTMLMERQLNYLCHDKINDLLPPFINLGVLGLNYGMQAMQFTATSTTAECQMLSNPMSIHSIPNNNDNQDVVSMGTNAALITKHVIENSFQVMAIHLIGLVQAVDYLKIASQLAPASCQLYKNIRTIVPVFTEDSPKYTAIEQLTNYLKENPLTNEYV